MSPRSRSPPPDSMILCGVPATRSVLDQGPATGTPHNYSRHIMCTAPLPETRISQGQRRVRQILRVLPHPQSEILQAAPRRSGRRRRLPQMRVPQATAGRLPLRAVPRRPRHRARAEAPGRQGRGGHRRVRRPARQGAPREQPRHRLVAVERTEEAGSLRGLLVAAAGPGAAGGTRVGALAVRHRLGGTKPASRQPRRVGSGRRALASRTLPEALSGSERPVKGDGYRRRSRPFTSRLRAATLAGGMATATPPAPFCAMTRRFRAALLTQPPSLPVRRAQQAPPQQSAQRCGGNLYVPGVNR